MMNNVHRSLSRFSFVALAALSLPAFVACGGSVEQPQTQNAAVQKAPVGPQTHGVVKMFGEALGEVALRPDQRTELESIALAADTRHAALRTGKTDIMLTLADQIEQGSIDRAALSAKTDSIVAELEKGRPEDAAALTRLHAMLDPDQRKAFADAVESKFKGKHGWKGGDADESAGQGGRVGGLVQLKQLYDDLALSDAQKTQIAGILKNGRDGHSYRDMHDRLNEGKQALESFRGETFDAATAAPTSDVIRARVAAGSAKLVGIAEQILPILTPEQRKVAADKLRARVNSGADVPFAH